MDLEASLNIPTADEAVHITVNNEKVEWVSGLFHIFWRIRIRGGIDNF